jgi:putative membrane-bound dehydrogenase-like protein
MGRAQVSTNALSPADELASFRLADDQLTIELNAAEPAVVSPVAMAWDAAGRLFVAEMPDYPNARSGGRIKLLADRHGDGRYEAVSVFADGLPFPNGVLPWNDGLLVTAAPDLWFFKDEDGDGRADQRRVLFTGFGEGNQQLRANGLCWGLDNWIYGANGRSDGEVWPANHPGAPRVSLRGHDFRFRPSTSEFEAIAGRSQFGEARNDWGDRFLSWNTIPIRHEVLPERFLARNPTLAATESIQDLLEPGDNGRVFPLTPPPLTFNDESTSHFNALAGLHVFRGDALGPAYSGNAFVGESLRNLIHRRVLEPSGPTFVARRAEHDREFLASTDPWFHPVNFATGPDGALYVADFYRRFVEHPDFVHTKARDEMPWRAGAEHGRLWRIRRKDFAADSRHVSLAGTSTADLVRALERTNGWWRDTAQRLLVERQDRKAAQLLLQTFRRGPRAETRVQALHVLEGLEALPTATLRAALKDREPRVREAGLRIFNDRSRPGLEDLLPGLVRDPDSRVRFQLGLALGGLSGESKTSALAGLAHRDATNRWHALALLSSVGPAGAAAFWQQWIRTEPHRREALPAALAGFLETASTLVGVSATTQDVQMVLAELGSGAMARPLRERLFAFAGLAEGLARAAHPLRQLQDPGSSLTETERTALQQAMTLAARTAADGQAAMPDRLAAIRVLKHSSSSNGLAELAPLLLPAQPPEVQTAAARILPDVPEAGLVRAVLARWTDYTRATRRELALAAARSPTASAEFVQALEVGTIQAVELPMPMRQALQRHPDSAVRQRADRFLQNAADADRAEVVRRFQPALGLAGDTRRGATLFARTCLQCHALQGQGQAVGPDLAGIGSRPKDAVLVDLLDPSRQVSPDFVGYSLVTAQGETLTGLIAAETATSVTLRRAGQADETLLRSQIKEWRVEGKSLMPDGLEQGMSVQDLADLLEFLRRPDAVKLP